MAREVSRHPTRVGLGVLVVFVLATWATWVRVRKPATPPQPESVPTSVPTQPLPSKTTAQPPQKEQLGPTRLPPVEAARRPAGGSRAPEKPGPAEKPGVEKKGRRELMPAQQAELKDRLATATFYMDRNDYDSGIVAYEEAARIDPSNLEARDGIQRARTLREALKTMLHR